MQVPVCLILKLISFRLDLPLPSALFLSLGYKNVKHVKHMNFQGRCVTLNVTFFEKKKKKGKVNFLEMPFVPDVR